MKKTVEEVKEEIAKVLCLNWYETTDNMQEFMPLADKILTIEAGGKVFEECDTCHGYGVLFLEPGIPNETLPCPAKCVKGKLNRPRTIRDGVKE